MSNFQLADLSQRERYLVMAASLCGPRPRGVIRANCIRVLKQALIWAGLWDEQMELDAREDGAVENPILEDWYRTLILMTQHSPSSEALIEGFGNMGSDTDPPAHANFTACHLTNLGRKLVKRLFAEHPECHV